MSATYILGVIIYVFSGLSILGSSFVVISYFTFSDLRSPSFSFALWLAISSLGFNSTTFLPLFDGSGDDQACKIYPPFETYFNLSAALTTAIVAKSITQIFANQSPQVSIEKWHVFVVWILPLSLIGLPYTTNSYGKNETDVHCFIKTDYSDSEFRNKIGRLWVFVTFYGPVICIIIYNTITYSKIIHQAQLLKVENPALASKIKSVLTRIQLYPLILILIYLVPLSHRLCELLHNDYSWLDQMAYCSLKLQGFLDSLAYGVNSSILARWRKIFENLLCIRNKASREMNDGIENKDVDTIETTKNDLHSPGIKGEDDDSPPTSSTNKDSSTLEMRGSSMFQYSVDNDMNIFQFPTASRVGG